MTAKERKILNAIYWDCFHPLINEKDPTSVPSASGQIVMQFKALNNARKALVMFMGLHSKKENPYYFEDYNEMVAAYNECIIQIKAMKIVNFPKGMPGAVKELGGEG